MDEQAIWVTVKKTPFGLEWTKIVAAQVIEDLNHQKFLLLGTMHTSLEFPLKYLDVDAVKQAALSYLGPEAFEQDAFDKVPASLTLTYRWNQLLDEATMAEFNKFKEKYGFPTEDDWDGKEDSCSFPEA